MQVKNNFFVEKLAVGKFDKYSVTTEKKQEKFSTLPEPKPIEKNVLLKQNSNLLNKDPKLGEDFNTSFATHSMFRENHGQMADYIYYYVITPQGMVGFGISNVSFVVNDQFFQLTFIDANPVRPKGVGQT
jgi:hypothetical protein